MSTNRTRLPAREILGLLFAVTLAGVACDPSSRAVPPRKPGDPALPGIEIIDGALVQELETAREQLGPRYRPRTRHLRAGGGPRYTNRLIRESSPYLLQHAHNPVNWYPWSEEAFERAKKEGKPIFLSVGYSTCHWCHVMEHESFEDEEIAAYLNRHFIAIKVDREERPDIDAVYMTAVQMLTGRGGWPMTLVMTPEKRPFFAGTYFPPRQGVRGNHPGLMELLPELLRLYRQEPERAVEQARRLSERLEKASTMPVGVGVPSDEVIVRAAQGMAASFDPEHGGFGRAPKFPQPGRLLLLMRYARRTKDPGALAMVDETLDRMAKGGIYDQLGGGFHRYATDARWLVPHFEKMLYDNALLAVVYLEAWQLMAKPEHRRVARETLDYVLREMTAPQGGFFSASDADSPTPAGHQEEGWFFTWTPAELEKLLGGPSARMLSLAYGVTDRGNFEGRNILNRQLSDLVLAKKLGLSVEKVREALAAARAKLYEARRQRPPPLVDRKVIAAWNGLMISALARGGDILNHPPYITAAARSASFVLDEMRGADGGLVRTRKDGRRGPPAFLDDYAFMVAACLDLYEATGQLHWLEQALSLQRFQDANFADRERGYFMTSDQHEALLVRQKPLVDAAVPSGNSLSALNLLRLAEFTADTDWQRRAEGVFASLAPALQRAPLSSPHALVALDYYLDVPLEVALLFPDPGQSAQSLSDVVRKTFLPNRVLARLSDDQAAAQQATVPWLTGKRSLRGVPTAYVCERGRCELPTADPKVLARQLSQHRPYPSGEPPALSVPKAP
jgi:uncharacterized protein YyaL (SSP411 family)